MWACRLPSRPPVYARVFPYLQCGSPRKLQTSALILADRKIPEPITKANPREKQRSLQYQRDLEEYQKNPDPEYVVVPQGSIFENEEIRKMMEDHAPQPPPRKTKSGSLENPYLIRHEYKFVDRMRVKAISGKGGNGCLSFDRGPHKPRGPPSGGNGGSGGDVIIRAVSNRSSLYGLQGHHFKATDGQSGQGKKRNGKNGTHAIVEVPPGTLVKRIRYPVEEDDGYWGEVDDGWQGLEEGYDLDVDEYLKQRGEDPEAFAGIPDEGTEFDGFQNSNIRVDPMSETTFDEVAHVNAKAHEQGKQFVVQEDVDEDLDFDYVVDESSGLEDSDSDSGGEGDTRIIPSQELETKVESRLTDLLRNRKITDEKQRGLTSEVIADLTDEGSEIIVAMGGRGAKGNQAYHWKASRTEGFTDKLKGGEREEISLELEMKMLAHVGLVGYPNAGKSTLLRAVSRATPKVASYPFTTLRPRIGMVDFEDYRQISVADLPGIIEGAHQNRGLGFTFLRHIERTNVLCFVVSMSQLRGEPIKHFRSLLEELEHFQPGITTAKKSVLVANKMDLGDVAQENFEDLQEFVEDHEGVLCPRGIPLFPVSAREESGIVSLLKQLYEFVYLNE